MKDYCPKCNAELIYDEMIEEYFDGNEYNVKWRMVCMNKDCDFEDYLWQYYRLEGEEWAK